MNLREMLVTEEKMNNYIERMNSVRGNESAIKELLADRETYVEYLKYIGVSQELYENPAVIEGSAKELEKKLMSGIAEATRVGIDCQKYIFGNKDGDFYISSDEYFREADGKVNKIADSTYLYERTEYNKFGLALEYHESGMDHDYIDYVRGKGSYSYDTYDGIATEDTGISKDSGNPFKFRKMSEEENPVKYYELYASMYPRLGKWMRTFFPEYQVEFDKIDMNEVVRPKFEYESTLEGKSDEEIMTIAVEHAGKAKEENSEKNEENNSKGQKIAEMVNEAKRLTEKVKVNTFDEITTGTSTTTATTMNMPNNINTFSEEELMQLLENLKMESRQILDRSIEQESVKGKIHSRINSLTRQKDYEEKIKEAEEAKRMKNPLYRVKKTVKNFMKNRKPEDDGSHESR